MNVYLKTIFTSKDEIPFIVAQILELESLVDKIIIIEPMFTHTGARREMIGVDPIIIHLNVALSKILYIPLPYESCINVFNSKDAHYNEKVTRGAFINYLDISLSDVVVSTDADEVLYYSYVIKILEKISIKKYKYSAYTANLYQFMFNDHLFAKEFRFVGPSIVEYGYYLFRPKLQNWRYTGKVIPEYGGVHFSWCLGKEQIIEKINNFAHAKDYDFGADSGSLIKSILEKKYYHLREPGISLELLTSPEDIWPKGYLQMRNNLGYSKAYIGTSSEDF